MPRVSSRRRQRGRGAADIPVVRPSTRRKIPAYELLDEESLVSLENHAEWLLTEIGIEIRGDAEALRLSQFTGHIPGYGMLDAQLNYHVPKINSTFKIGASNLLNKRVYQTYGGPIIGRLAYVSVLVELKK